MNLYKEYHLQFDKVLNHFIEELNISPNSLYEPMRYIFSLGGKRIRPLLVYIANDLFNGNTSHADSPALAVEIFHNFSLIHDDIMDNAPLRRGKKTIHETWNTNVAILSGDALLIKAYQQLILAKQDCIAELISVFNKTALEVCEGQQFDMDFEQQNNVSLDAYMQMITLKTAVLLGAALKMGAITAKASSADAEHIYQFGKNLGIAFQLQDDLLDVFGNPDKFGKQVGGDIVSNKKTWLLIRALQDASAKDRAVLEKWINQKQFSVEEKVTAFKSIYEKLNIKEKVENETKQYFEFAKSNLHAINANNIKKDKLLSFAENIMNREN